MKRMLNKLCLMYIIELYGGKDTLYWEGEGMNTTIYVFSGTGTSLAMATNICNAMENTNIVSIPQALEGGM